MSEPARYVVDTYAWVYYLLDALPSRWMRSSGGPRGARFLFMFP
mgnify:CR=1 FL=1